MPRSPFTFFSQITASVVFVAGIAAAEPPPPAAPPAKPIPPATPVNAPTPPAITPQDAAPAFPASESAAKTREVVQKVQRFYDKTQSFRSDFKQKYWVKAYNQEKTSSGSVIFVKPGQMKWTYDQPAGNKVVSDGKMLWVYEAENKQMIEQKVDRSQYPAALSFLTGQGKLADSFSFEVLNGEKMNFPRGFVLVGTPKQATQAYQKVLFYVDAESSEIRRVLIMDGQGNRNRFDFERPSVNLKEDKNPNQFKFIPPAGTSVIRP